MTCAVDVTATFARKLAALDPLSYQAEYTAEVFRHAGLVPLDRLP